MSATSPEDLQKLTDEKAARAADIEKMRIATIARGAESAGVFIAAGIVAFALGCVVFSSGLFVALAYEAADEVVNLLAVGGGVLLVGVGVLAVGVLRIVSAWGLTYSQRITENNK